jgi:P27 family predicted phage terminase small subunit
MRKVPTHLRLLRGNPGKRPIKPEPEPSVPEMLPEPPSFLSVDAVNEWWRVVPELRALGLLTVLDVQPLAAYCVAYSHWIAAEQALAQMAAEDSNFNGLMITGSTGSRMANPLVKIARNAAADMLRFAGEFGMTPHIARIIDWDPIRELHHGPRSNAPHLEAGHTTATCSQCRRRSFNYLQMRVVHIGAYENSAPAR